jgi:tryptophanyl-tRNA synthetase
LFQLHRLFATREQVDELQAIYLRGGFGYGDVKKRLAEAADIYLGPARERRKQLESDPQRVRDILQKGASKARLRASQVLERVEKACGIK